MVLVNDRTELSDKLVIENPTFEEIMNMFVKGNESKKYWLIEERNLYGRFN